jgi:ribosome-associated translation inhibitor RaiA
MGRKDAGPKEFDFEFHTDGVGDPDRLRDEAEPRLRELAEGHRDMTGASVSVREAARAETSVFEARVVAYMKPKNVAGTEKAASPIGALKGALEAVERQVRKRRDKIRTRAREQRG